MKTYYDNLFTKAVSTKLEYIKKIESLIFAEKSVDKNGIVLCFLEQKLTRIKNYKAMKKVQLFESEKAKNFFAVATVDQEGKVYVNYFKFDNGNQLVIDWTPELKPFIPLVKDWCEENNFTLWSY